jgi:hypothetical protein
MFHKYCGHCGGHVSAVGKLHKFYAGPCVKLYLCCSCISEAKRRMT